MPWPFAVIGFVTTNVIKRHVRMPMDGAHTRVMSAAEEQSIARNDVDDSGADMPSPLAQPLQQQLLGYLNIILLLIILGVVVYRAVNGG